MSPVVHVPLGWDPRWRFTPRLRHKLALQQVSTEGVAHHPNDKDVVLADEHVFGHQRVTDVLIYGMWEDCS